MRRREEWRAEEEAEAEEEEQVMAKLRSEAERGVVPSFFRPVLPNEDIPGDATLSCAPILRVEIDRETVPEGTAREERTKTNKVQAQRKAPEADESILRVRNWSGGIGFWRMSHSLNERVNEPGGHGKGCPGGQSAEEAKTKKGQCPKKLGAVMELGEGNSGEKKMKERGKKESEGEREEGRSGGRREKRRITRH